MMRSGILVANLKQVNQLCIPHLSRDDNEQEVVNLINWFNGSLLRKLTVCVDLSPDNWGPTAKTIKRFRDNKLAGKSDPQFRLFINDDDLENVDLREIEAADVRLPRLDINILFRDKDGFPNINRRIVEAKSHFQHRLLNVRPYLLVVHSIESLRDLDRQCEAETPLVEMEKPPSDDIEKVVSYIAEFWSRHPNIDDVISLSRGGLFHRFHAVKELWHLEQVLPSSEDWLASHLDAWQADETVRAFCHNLAARITMQDYYRWKYRRKSAALEFDVDSISDSSECQSPVFMNNRWVIEEARTAKEESLEVRQWGDPFAAS